MTEPEPEPEPEPAGGAALPSVWGDPTRRFQALEGFGAAFSEAAAVTRLKLGPAQLEAVLRDGFDPERGHG